MSSPAGAGRGPRAAALKEGELEVHHAGTPDHHQDKANNPPPAAGPLKPPPEPGQAAPTSGRGRLKLTEMARRKARQAIEKLKPHEDKSHEDRRT